MRPDHERRDPDDNDLGGITDVLDSMTDADSDMEMIDTTAGLWDEIAERLIADESPVIDDEVPTEGTVIDLDSRRRNRWVRIAGAAAVVMLAAGTYGLVTSNTGSSTQEVVASVDLDVLSGPATADAELIRVDGSERLVVDTRGLPIPPAGTHYELWMIDAGVSDPRSMGTIAPGDQVVEVDVPDGVDPSDFPIVDINVQDDGAEQHSGPETSILRGLLV